MDQRATNNNVDQLVSGSAWLTVGQTVSRLLGALYIIPWTILLGQYYLQANGLFNKGYTIYALFLMLSTAGIPSAISDLVAKYFASNQPSAANKIFRQAIRLGIILGVIAAVFLYFGATLLSIGDDNLPNVLKSLAPAVLIFPVISIVRGFFQGQHDMKTSAISQVIEQIVRIAYMLISAFVILQVDSSDWVKVTIHSTFAAFIGAVASFLYLGFILWQQRNQLDNQVVLTESQLTSSSTNQMIIQIIRKAMPFILIGSAITIFQLIDQYTYPFIQNIAGVATEEIDLSFARFNANANKLVMIIVPFATAIAASALPILAEQKMRNERQEIRSQLDSILRLFALVMLPSAFGMYAVAEPLYTVFYGVSDPNQAQGIALLQVSCIMAIMFGLFMILTTSLQALENTKVAFRAFLAAIIIKIVLQFPLVSFFDAFGDLWATILAFAFANFVLLDFVNYRYHAGFSHFIEDLKNIFITSIAILIASFVTVKILNIFIAYTRFGQIFTLLISTAVGILVAILLVRRFNLGSILGGRFSRFL